MTQPTPEQLEVAQADRDAAADRLESTIPEKFRNLHPATHTAKAIRKGKMDGHPWVQNYARHRILAIQATEARMAAAVEAGYALAMSSGKMIVALDNMEVFKHHREALLRDMKAFADAYAAIRSQSNG